VRRVCAGEAVTWAAGSSSSMLIRGFSSSNYRY
jgi:hypothetical protein